jgi:hypothetical protein
MEKNYYGTLSLNTNNQIQNFPNTKEKHPNYSTMSLGETAWKISFKILKHKRVLIIILRKVTTPYLFYLNSQNFM